MTFDTDVRGPQRIKANNFYDPLTFHLAPAWGWLLWLSSYWMDCHEIWLFISRHHHIQKFQYFGFWPNTSKAKDFPISLKQWTFLTSALALWACWCYHLARSVAVPEYSLSELPAWLWTSFFTIDEMKKKRSLYILSRRSKWKWGKAGAEMNWAAWIQPVMKNKKVKENDKPLQALSLEEREGEERHRGRQSYEPLV